ncbi:MAG: hypothetical protein AB1497_04200 [Bacillota bacterium]
MFLIGNRLNTKSANTEAAVLARDEQYVIETAEAQLDAGALFLEVGASTLSEVEREAVLWLLQVIQKMGDVPLALDSGSPETIGAFLSAVKSRPMLLGLAPAGAGLHRILPLVSRHLPYVSVLCTNGKGVLPTQEQRFEAALNTIEIMAEAGVPTTDLYLDPVLEPLCLSSQGTVVALDTISSIKRQIQGVRTICSVMGLASGLPSPGLLLSGFLMLAEAAGLDAVVADPLDPSVKSGMISGAALLGLDNALARYIKHHNTMALMAESGAKKSSRDKGT